MVTTKLIEILKAKIISVMKMPMLKRMSSAQDCIVDSVNVINSLNTDVVTLSERVKELEVANDILLKEFRLHVKRGH